MARGINWSTIYQFNSVVMVLIALWGMAMLIGVTQLETRICVNVTSPCCCCINLAILILSAVYRFNTKGTLASISMTSSKFVETHSVGVFLSEDRTYENDANRILTLILVQTAFLCCFQCCGFYVLNRLPTKEEALEYGVAKDAHANGADGEEHQDDYESASYRLLKNYDRDDDQPRRGTYHRASTNVNRFKFQEAPGSYRDRQTEEVKGSPSDKRDPLEIVVEELENN